MGYYSTLQNQADISPEIKWSDIKDKSLAGPDNWNNVVWFKVEDIPEDADDGTLIRKIVSGIEVVEDSGKMYDWQTNMQKVWDTIHAAGSHMTGYIARYGEDSTDIERAIEVDGKLVFQNAEIRWPDGGVVDSNY